MGRKFPVVPQPLHNKHVSHHSILPQAESQVTNNNSQLGSHMAPNMSNPTPSRNMSVARASNPTPNRGAHQFGIRAGNPGGGDSSDNSSSDSDTQDQNRSSRRDDDRNGGGNENRRPNSIGFAQRRREDRQNSINTTLSKQLDVIIRNYNTVKREKDTLPICKYEDVLDLIKECKITISKADKSNVRINNGNVIRYIDY